MSTEPLPKYYKDATGFCYTATRLISTQRHLEPWDGLITEAGFAIPVEGGTLPVDETIVEEAAVDATPVHSKSRSKSARKE